MKNTVQTVLPPLVPRRKAPAYLRTTALTSVLLAPFALVGLAGAQSTDAASQLTSGAKSQMEAAVPLIVGLLVVGIGLTVAFMVNKNAKKGINKAG